MQQSCPKCYGHGIETIKCNVCNGEKRKLKDISQQINIPGGARTGAKLRLSGAGHYEPFLQAMQNAILEIEVEPHPTLTFDGRDVHFTLNLSLLDALRGVPDQKIDTIYGQSERTTVVPALCKNAQVLILDDLGVNGNGVQFVHINVIYPDNVSDIISLLEKSQNSSEPKEECPTL
jgi:molecular chaperone DnaJ